MRTLALAAVLSIAASAPAIDEAHRRQAETMIDGAIDFLRTQQDETGGWSLREGRPVFPAITVSSMASQVKS